MNRFRYLLRSAAFALLTAFVVVSAVFGFVALTPDPGVDAVAWEAAAGPPGKYNETEAQQRVNEAVAAYRESRHLDEPVSERYVRWLGNVVTLDWGESFVYGRPVSTLVGRALPRTLAYVVPSLLVSTFLGVPLGLYAARRAGSVGGRLGRLVAAIGAAVPNFWVAELYLLFGVAVVSRLLGAPGAPPETLGSPALPQLLGGDIRPVLHVLVPTVVLSATLFAGQFRHARAEARDYLDAEFVTLLRAKGASEWRVARHVVRNAALPLLSLTLTELLAVLVVNVYVLELAFGIPGLGWLSYRAIIGRDLPLVIGTSMVVVFVAIAGNFLQDVAALGLDPRAGD